MDQAQVHEPNPTFGSVDKSRVLNVKPLRSLVPIFPSQSNLSSFPTPPHAGSFVGAPPLGPFPPGFGSFYPFSGSSDPQNAQAPYGFATPISAAVPINSFRTPGTANGDAGPSRKGKRGRPRLQSHEEDGYSFSMHGTDGEDTSKLKQRKTNRRSLGSQDINFASSDIDIDSMVNDILQSFNLVDFDTYRRTDGDRESVGYVLLIYELLKRKISQIEDSKQAIPGVTRRPDLRAGTILLNKGVRTNSKKRIGGVAGVEIGDIFFFRMELCLVGLHSPSMAGIDYMSLKVTQDEEPVAVSIVSSGGYDDNVEDGDVLIYSGQGGNVNRKDKQITDQKLERGNLALEKSLHRGNEIRVIRGVRDIANPTGKIYVYDGLYKIQESWVDKGKSGCNVFKYKLVRLPGQPEAFTLWKSIQQWKDGVAPRVGVILPDLTSGAENLPVSLVNDVDDEKGPAYFTYSPVLKYSKPVNPVEASVGCPCQSGCLPGKLNCSCIQRNGSYLPYTVNGLIVTPKSLIYECGQSCQCPPNCRNRVSQGGLKVRLEVYKTKNRGWGLRSWDPIRAGAFICEYAGEVFDFSRAEELHGENDDDYIFDATRTYHPVEGLPGELNEAPKIPFPLVISAKNVGNVARFMNNSCSPNVFWQPVLRENDKECDLHVVFYAIKHIPPMTELTYNYGMVPPNEEHQRKKKCLCGSPKCRGYFF